MRLLILLLNSGKQTASVRTEKRPVIFDLGREKSGATEGYLNEDPCLAASPLGSPSVFGLMDCEMSAIGDEAEGKARQDVYNCA